MTYDAYEPGAVAGPAESEDLGAQGPWRVLIEYSNRGDIKPPTVLQIGKTEHSERAVALRAALRACREFNPSGPSR